MKHESLILRDLDQKPDTAELHALMSRQDHGPGDVQRTTLTDTRVPLAQRQAIASQIEQTQGNLYLQRLLTSSEGSYLPGSRNTAEIQRQDDTTTEDTAPATETASAEGAEPELVFTEFGSFVVYPNDFVGPLPAADYATGGWPVRQMIFDRIESVLDSISGGVVGFKIEGDDAFKAVVLMDLAWLMTQSTGMDLIEAIAYTEKNMIIKSTGGGNTMAYDPDAHSFEILAPGGIGPPAVGHGANITIEYNTQEWNPYGGEEEWMTRSPAIGLAHEMVHGWTGMSGIRAVGETGGVRRRRCCRRQWRVR